MAKLTSLLSRTIKCSGDVGLDWPMIAATLDL